MAQYKNLSPAEVAISEFGGVRPLARLLDMTPGAIAAWKPGRRGDGRIPAKHQKALIELAAKRGRQLTPDELVFGRKVLQRARLKARG